MSEVKFKREDRYAVFKFSDMDEAQMRILQDTICRLPRRECVVVESDCHEGSGNLPCPKMTPYSGNKP